MKSGRIYQKQDDVKDRKAKEETVREIKLMTFKIRKRETIQKTVILKRLTMLRKNSNVKRL